MRARDIIKAEVRRFEFGSAIPEHVAEMALAKLAAAGYRILGPDELDKVTIERCAKEMDDHSAGKFHSAEITIRDWVNVPDISAEDRASNRAEAERERQRGETFRSAARILRSLTGEDRDNG